MELEESALLPFGLESVGAGAASIRAKKTQLDRRYMLKVGLIALAVICIIGLVVGLSIGLSKSTARKPAAFDRYLCPPSLKLTPSDLVFFVVGDWGRGNPHQRVAASMMMDVATCLPPAFVISTGDNFYPHGLEGANDSQWRDSFSGIYTSDQLKVPWYSVMGNHDYGDQLLSVSLLGCPNPPPASVADCKKGCCYSPLWQVTNLSETAGLNSLDPRWQQRQGAWRVDHPEHNLSITYIDTTPFLDKYRDKAWANVIGGVSSQDSSAQALLVDQLLAESSAGIKLAVGHHPVRSYGEHCSGGGTDCDVMSAWLQPLLWKHKVLAYLCGHEHNMQYIKKSDDAVHYIVSGAGSDVREGEFGDIESEDDDLFLQDGEEGFAAVVMRQGAAAPTLYFWTSSEAEPALVRKLG